MNYTKQDTVNKHNLEEFEDYLTNLQKCSKMSVISYSNTVRKLYREVNKSEPKELTYEDIKKVAVDISNNTNYADKSKRAMLSGLKRYVRYLQSQKHIDIYKRYKHEVEEDPDVNIFRHKGLALKKKKETLTIDEINRLLEVSKYNLRDHALIRTLYHSTQRSGSIQNLNIEDIDFKGEVDPTTGKPFHRIKIKHSKRNAPPYDVLVEPECIDAIKDYIDNAREKPMEGYVKDNYGNIYYHKDAVFLNGTGGRLKNTSISHILQVYGVHAGITKKMFTHNMRASAITIMDSNKTPLSHIQQRTGHKNTASLSSYFVPQEKEAFSSTSEGLNLNKKETQEEPKIPKPEIPDVIDLNFKQVIPSIQDTQLELKVRQMELMVRSQELDLLNKEREIELEKLKSKLKDNNMFG